MGEGIGRGNGGGLEERIGERIGGGDGEGMGVWEGEGMGAWEGVDRVGMWQLQPQA